MSTTTTTEDQTLARLIAKRDQARAELQQFLPAVVGADIEARAIEAAGLRQCDPARVALSRFMADAVARFGQAA